MQYHDICIAKTELLYCFISGSTAGSDHRSADADTDHEGATLSDEEAPALQLSGSSLPVRTYTCIECGEATTSARDHLFHLVEEHQHDITVYECDLCEYATKYKHKLPRHRRCHFTSPPPGGVMAAPLVTPAKKGKGSHIEQSSKEDILIVSEDIMSESPDGSPHLLEVDSGEVPMKDMNENVKDHGTKKIPGPDTEEHDLICEETLADTSYTDVEPDAPVAHEPMECDFTCEESVANNDSSKTLHEKKISNAELPKGPVHTVTRFEMQYEEDNEHDLVIDLGENQNQNNNCAMVTEQTMKIPVTVSPVVSPTPSTASQPSSKSNNPVPPGMKLTKKGTVPVREAVDPAKYVRLQDVDGVRYACSKCGNVYKWRKSLNKHWKEKHDGEIPVPTSASFTMLNIPHIKGSTATHGTSKSSLASFRVTPASLLGGSNTSSYSLDKFIVDRGAQGGGRHLQSPAFDSGSLSPAASAGSQTDIYGKPGTYDAMLRTSPFMCSTPTPPVSHSTGMRPSFRRDSGGSRSRGKCSNLEKLPYNIHSVPEKPISYREMYYSVAPPAHSQRTIKREEPEADNDDMMPLDLSKSSRVKGPGNALDLSKPIGSKHSSARYLATDQPLDFSRKSNSDSERSTPALQSGPRLKKEAEEFMEALWLRSTSTPDSQSSLYSNLQCYRCPFVAKDKISFEEHMEQHTSISYPQCAQCQQPFSSNDELTQHFGLHHLHILHQIELLDDDDPRSVGTSPEARQLYQYLTKPRESREHKCIVCSAKFPWQHDLAKHFTHLHPDLPNPYKKHYLEPDNGSEPGNKRAKYDKRWQVEQFTSSDGKYGPEDELECEQCSFIARDPAEMTRHQLVHSLNRPHACTMCGYSTKVREDLTVHVWKYHPSHAEELALMASSGSSTVSSLPGAVYSAANYGNDSFNQSADMSGSSGHSSSMEFGFDDVIVVTPNTTDVPLVRGRKCGKGGPSSSAEILLPYKCSVCEYRARWPSEITQHMKNHSDEKPYLCPRCTYKSKWKWDVVKHLKRCGGGTVKDVIDTSRLHRKSESSGSSSSSTVTNSHSVVKALQFKNVTPKQSILSNGPPNVTVLPNLSMRIPVSQMQQHSPSSFMHMQSTSEEACLVPYSRSTNSPDSSPTHMSMSEPMSPSGSNKAKGTVFRSIINQGQYHCLQCPFIGNSPAELKRHCRVHSDEKPFACATCGYSSKWKCDLKKHLRTYNHVAAPRRDSLEAKQKEDSYRLMSSAMEGNQSSSDEMSVDMNTGEPRSISPLEPIFVPKPTLYKCDKCQYVTYKKNFLEGHMNIHGQTREKKSGKLKCKQCDFEASDLPSFLQHKLTHSTQQGSESTITLESSLCEGAQRLVGAEKEQGSVRHRRKPLKYLCCSRCPYTCLKQDKLEVHEAMHEPRGPDALTCEFCDYNVYSRGLLFQHMKLHPEFDEWYATNGESFEEEAQMEETEEIEMDEAEHTESLCDGAVNLSVKACSGSGGMKLLVANPSESGAGFKCNKCPYISEQRSSFEAHIRHHGCSQEFKCEYCDWSVDQLNLLYKHVKDVHPQQWSLLETPEPNSKGETPLTAAGLERGKIELVSKDSSDTVKAETAGVPLVQKERAGRKKQRKPQTCGDCGYITDNPAKMVQHRLKHNPDDEHKCHYCNTSIATIAQMQEHLLQIHDVHVEEEACNTKVVESVSSSNQEKMAKDSDPQDTHTQTQDTSSQSEDDKAAKPKKLSEATKKRLMSHSPSPHRKASPSPARSDGDASNPDEQTAEPQMMEIKGQQVRVRFYGNRKVFTCPKCSYKSSNSTHCASHIQQHGSGKTYMCEYCDYSLDKLSHILYHMKMCHPNEVEASETDTEKVVSKSENAETVLKREQKSSVNLTDDRSASNRASSPSISTSTSRKLLSCTRCPYGTKSREALHRHMEMHEYKGKYICQHCDYSVDRMNLLQQHKRVHSESGTKTKTQAKVNGISSARNKANIIGRGRKPVKPMLGKSMLKITSAGLGSKGRMKTRYRCTRCPYTTVCKSNIVKHRRLHLVTSKFRCQQCNYSATRYFLLQQHIKFHATTDEDSAEYQDIYLDPDQEEPTPLAGKVEDMDVDKGPPKGGDQSDSRHAYELEGKRAKTSKPYLCKDCPFSGIYSYEYRKHLKFHGASHQYKCDYCTYSVAQMDLLVHHRRLHAGEAGFTSSPDRTKLINPSASLEEKTQKLECTKCPYKSISEKNYSLHKSLHGAQKKYICEYCDLSCDALKVMLQHRQLHCHEAGFKDSIPASHLLRTQKAGQATRMFSLPKLRIALKPLSPKKSQKKDVNEVAQRKLYNCKHCPFSCNKKQSYESHSRLHGAVGRYPCSQCTYTVDRMNLLQQHARLHNPPQPAARNGAGTLLANKRLVKKRLRCSKCPYHIHSQSLLDLHMKMHAAGQRYTCEFCDYSIGRQNLLQQHMKIHSTCITGSNSKLNAPNEEPGTTVGSPLGVTEKSKFYYKCDRCPYQTNNKNNFENHKTQHVMRSKLNCPYCDYSSPRTGQLASHVRLHFPGAHLDGPTLRSLISGANHADDFNPDTPLTADDTDPGTPSAGDLRSREGSAEPLNNNNEQERKENVCQYCERNFTDEAEKDWHEQQHLIGSGTG